MPFLSFYFLFFCKKKKKKDWVECTNSTVYMMLNGLISVISYDVLAGNIICHFKFSNGRHGSYMFLFESALFFVSFAPLSIPGSVQF